MSSLSYAFVRILRPLHIQNTRNKSKRWIQLTSGALRSHSSMPSPQSSTLSESTSYSFGNVLEIADWAQRATTIQPPQRSSFPSSRTSSVLEQPLSFHAKDVNIEESEEILARGQAMDSSQIDQWLYNIEIPSDQLASCSSSSEIESLRHLYARQVRLESCVSALAQEKRFKTLEDLKALGIQSPTNRAKHLILHWMPRATDLIQAERKRVMENQHSLDSNTYGPAFVMLKPNVLAALGINIILNQCLMDGDGAKFIKLALAMGKAIQEEIIMKKEKEKSYKTNLKRMKLSSFVEKKVEEYYTHVGGWDKRVNLKVGAALVDCLLRSCMIPNEFLSCKKDELKPAFHHSYIFDRNRRAGVIQLDPIVHQTLQETNRRENVLPWTVRYLPMLVPPKPWTDVSNGGYLTLQSKIMRQRDTLWQMECVKRGEMQQLLETLNELGNVPWKINTEVLDVILKIWEAGGDFGDIPRRMDYKEPEYNEEEEGEGRTRSDYEKTVRKIRQRNRELHSLRCDTLYKLQVAEEFKNEDALYYPYNMDFRGRVYPIPPNLNHLGSDLSRSLLVFKEKKTLGKNGLKWLKIHFANVFGIDKCSFQEREAFTDANLDKIIASATDPLSADDPACQFWKDADYPFLALGVCFELKRALACSNPEEYLSNIPIHQDGSCNGLQHYAALGRDLKGGEQVNLVPAPRPCDVYTGVATQVMQRVEHDAHMELPETFPPVEEIKATDSPEEKERKLEIKALHKRKRDQHYARFLLGHISRKVVKQTVMTSVYGVTYIGARKQISARLEEVFIARGEILDAQLESEIYYASCYAADLTMASMGNLFTSARTIMEWLSDCALKVAQNGQAMSWMTPLGLPVVQPYRKSTTQQVRTKVQHVLLVLNEELGVSRGRQKSAFPPNFIHSLDSTHMLLTAHKCLKEDQISFAAVHDSYWTHASTVDVMNHRLREAFIDLYSQPILEELLQDLRLRFPNTEFKDVPACGNLDLEIVLQSPYFFN